MHQFGWDAPDLTSQSSPPPWFRDGYLLLRNVLSGSCEKEWEGLYSSSIVNPRDKISRNFLQQLSLVVQISLFAFKENKGTHRMKDRGRGTDGGREQALPTLWKPLDPTVHEARKSHS